jgi:hypothetical protein
MILAYITPVFYFLELLRLAKSNRIQIASYRPLEKSVGGQTCQFRQVKKSFVKVASASAIRRWSGQIK